MKKLVKVLLVFVVVGFMFFAHLGVRQGPPQYPDDRPISHINSTNPGEPVELF